MNPHSHYAYGMGSNQMNELRKAFERMTDTDTAAAALSELPLYRMKSGSFAGELAKKMATDRKTFPSMDLCLLFVDHLFPCYGM